jgi:phosphoribosylanthranilate isomerase
MNVKLKICGMRDRENILAAAALLPDLMGFIFYERSPRFVGSTFKVPHELKGVERVGVFVNASIQIMVEKVAEHQLEYVQLHGNESVEQCEELKRNKIKIIKAFPVDDEMDFRTTKPYQQVCDYFLFDTKGKYFGGNGKAFNWAVLERYDQRIPFFISGGITPENVKDVRALTSMNLYAVDVNSGVEKSAGVKDVQAIERLKEILYANQ